MIRELSRAGWLCVVLVQACTGQMEPLPEDATAPVNASQSAEPIANARAAMSPMAASASRDPGAVAPLVPATSMAPREAPAVTPVPATAGSAQPQAPSAGESTDVNRDECGLKTRFSGDQFCIKAPPPDKGFQLHFGPSNYDNPEKEYVLEPGEENTVPYNGVTGNDKEVYFFYRQQRMRPGSHHLLMFNGSDLLVSAQNPNADIPQGGRIAPEDQAVGIPLAARTRLTGSIHYINTTDKPILKEVWVNFWYKPESEVKERAQTIFTSAPINVQPGAHVVISSDCPIMGSGRIIRLFGHKHANNIRWSTYRVRNGQRDVLFEDYSNWEEPLILEYSSITQNPKPDRATQTPGGMSGIVDVRAGDTLRFECEVVNRTNRVFTGQAEAVDDEMCIQNGTTVGAQIIRGTCLSATTPVQ